MRLKVMVTAFAASAALLMSSTVLAAGLLDGEFIAVDDKNPRIGSETEVLEDGARNDVTVVAKCQASTGEEIGFIFSAFERPSKTNITETKATIDKNRKEEPAFVAAVVAGICDDEIGDSCFLGFPDVLDPDLSDCGFEIGCIEREFEDLDCETAKVKSTVNAKSDTINWSAQAKKCVTASAPLTAAIDAACGKKGENKGISISVKDSTIKKLKIKGKSKDAIVLP